MRLLGTYAAVAVDTGVVEQPARATNARARPITTYLMIHPPSNRNSISKWNVPRRLIGSAPAGTLLHKPPTAPLVEPSPAVRSGRLFPSARAQLRSSHLITTAASIKPICVRRRGVHPCAGSTITPPSSV